MFNLDKHQVRIANVNPRAEKHGAENKLATDIKIEFTASNEVLNEFSKDLRAALYRKPGKGEQQDLIDGPNALTAVKFPLLGAVSWDDEFTGYELEISSGLGLVEPLIMVDITLKKFRFEPLEGGSVAISFNAICHPDADECGQLCSLIQEDAVLTLTPPSKQAEQQLAA